MRKLAIVAALVLTAGTARAVDQGFSVGARVGFGLPMGDVASNVSLGDSVTGVIPVWLEASYRFTPNFSAGIYGQYGYALPKNCPAGVSCSGYNLRFGAQAFYSFTPQAKFAPYVGIGTGYESLSASANNNDAKFSGWEYATLHVGGDWKSSPAFSFGPFATFSLGSYGSASVNGVDVAGFSSSTHMWLQAGFRGTFNF